MSDPGDNPFGGFVGLEPLDGSTSGEVFLAETAAERSVLRIFAAPHHPPGATEIHAALLHLVRDLVPVPPVLEVRRSAGDHPGLLVTGLLDGVRADLLLPELSGPALRRAGAALGAVAAALAAMPTLRAGAWADPELRIAPGGSTVTDRVARQGAALVARGWADADVEALTRHAGEADERLGAVRRTCVVHGDLVPRNLLVDPETLEVTGVVDWERSHSGHPWTDLGALLGADRRPDYVEGVLGAWGERHPVAPQAVEPQAVEQLAVEQLAVEELAVEALAAGAAAAELERLVRSVTEAGTHPDAEGAAERLRGLAGAAPG